VVCGASGVGEEVASGDAVGVALAEAVGVCDGVGDATVDVCEGATDGLGVPLGVASVAAIAGCVLRNSPTGGVPAASGAGVIAADGAEINGCSRIALSCGNPACARASSADATSIQIRTPISNALEASPFDRPIMTTMPPQHSLRFRALRARGTHKARMARHYPVA